MGLLDGTTVLITGAGAGLGRGIALAAAAAGAHVVVTSISENGQRVREEIRDGGGEADWVVCDVTDRRAVEHAVEESVRLTGRLDGVVHNALSRPDIEEAAPESRSLADLPLELWEHQAAVAIRGAYYCAVAAHPHLVANKGRLILVTSAGGLEGGPHQPAYAACKGAIRGLTKSLAREWGPAGVTVNCVSPFVSTPAFDRAWEKEPGAKAATLRLTSLKYLGDPLKDVAPAFVFLLSDLSHYVTGQTIPVDSGRYIAL